MPLIGDPKIPTADSIHRMSNMSRTPAITIVLRLIVGILRFISSDFGPTFLYPDGVNRQIPH